MDLMKMGQQVLGDKMGDQAGGMMEGISGLTGGKLDMGSLMSKLTEGGLGEQVKSWMGDGENEPVSADQLKEALGEDQIAAASEKMGLDSDSAAQKLSEALPDLTDKFSSGGSLLDASGLAEKLGGASGIVGMIKGLFNK